MDAPKRPRRQAAQKAMSAFVLPEASSDDTNESNEEEISDFDENGENDDPSSTSSSPNANQSSSASAATNDVSDDEPIRRTNRPSFLPPFYKLLPPLGRVGFNSTDPKEIVMDFFKDELNYRTSIGSKYPHPFSFFTPKSGLSERSTFMERQKLLFSLNNFTSLPQNEIANYLPESVHCPKMVFLEDQKRVKATRYHFNEERNLFYTGGYVKCLDWSPPHIEETGDPLTCIPKYLAVASYPNNGTRVILSDPIMKEFGLIHIWSCSGLALTKEQSRLDIKPHFFLAHDWGYIMDLRWIPIPVQYAKTNPVPPLPYGPATDEDQPKASSSVSSSLEFHPTQVDQLVGCVVGHLIAACTDGFVRIFPIPCHDNRKRIAAGGKLVIPTSISADGVPQNIYKLKPNGALLLAPGAGKEIPPWLGWPNLLAIRTGFPHYLMVAYTSGHLGIYIISTLDSFDLRIKHNLLRPTLLTHRQPGPFSSIALHPLRENYVIGLGLDRDMNLWNLDDVTCITSGAGNISELCWTMMRTGIGGCVVWPRVGDNFWVGRQEYLFPFCSNAKVSSAVSVSALKAPTDVPSRMRNYTIWFPTVSPNGCCRYCFDRGFEAVTCLEYSDALCLAIQGDSNGQINFHSWALTPCRVMRAKTRISIQRMHRSYQWIMQKRTDIDDDGKEVEDLAEEITTLDLNVMEEPFEGKLAEGCDLCGENGQALCWHKVEDKFEFVFREGVDLKKNKYDFLNSTFSSITRIAPCRDPGSATWMAVGTGFGIVQLICHDQFYHPEMDEALGRSPLKEGPAKGCFFVTKPPPSENVNSSSILSTSAPPQWKENSRKNGDRKATIPRRSLKNRRS